MDIYQLADKNCIGKDFQCWENEAWYREGFLEGHQAATQWHPMDSAVRKDDNCILIAHKHSRTGEILVTECFYDSAEGDFCWDRYQIVKNPIAWTNLPIYKPENQ